MISLHTCPRCNGAVLEYHPPENDGALCINCGWRRRQIPREVQIQVEAHLGETRMEDRYSHSRIGTGKPPLSGWDRVKRRKARETGFQASNSSPVGHASEAANESVSTVDSGAEIAS